MLWQYPGLSEKELITTKLCLARTVNNHNATIRYAAKKAIVGLRTVRIEAVPGTANRSEMRAANANSGIGILDHVIIGVRLSDQAGYGAHSPLDQIEKGTAGFFLQSVCEFLNPEYGVCAQGDDRFIGKANLQTAGIAHPDYIPCFNDHATFEGDFLAGARSACSPLQNQYLASRFGSIQRTIGEQ